MKDIDTIIQLLDSTIYCNLATVSTAGLPLSTPVFFGYDNDCNIYWRSANDAQHSRDLLSQPVVAISVYNSEQPWGRGQGLYVTGQVTELNEVESTQAALDVLDRRSKHGHQASDFLAPQPVRVYKCTPEQIWTNVSTGTTVLKDSRQQLEWKV